MNKWIRILLVGAAAVGTLFPAARAATYHFNLPEKNLEGATLALGESATLILKGIGESDPADLRTLLCDKKGEVLAASGTNAFSRCDECGPARAARGTMSLATANLATLFAGAPALGEKALVLACWDNRLGTLLASANVQVRNNPFASTNGVVPSNWGGVDYGDAAIAQQALAAAQLALNTANATSLDLAALLGDYQTATGGLWTAVGELQTATNSLDGRVEALESGLSSLGTDTADSLAGLGEALTNAMGSIEQTGRDIEAAFTNGTAKGLSLAVPPSWINYGDAEFALQVYTDGTGGSHQVWLQSSMDILGLSLVDEWGTDVAGVTLLATGKMNLEAYEGIYSDDDIKAYSFTLGTNTVTDWSVFASAVGLSTLSGRFDDAVASLEAADTAASNRFEIVTFDLRYDIDALADELHTGDGSISNRLRLAEAAADAAQAWAQTNRDDIADLRADAAWLHAAATNNAANINILSAADNALANQIHATQESISDLWSAIGYVANTNGAWRIVDAVDWYGLEWNGERVFGAVLDGPTGDGARILSLGFGEEEGTLELTFIGAATNHLEACNDRTNWFTWDDCAWSYSGITGTVAIANAAETNWYRVVAEGAVYGWSNAAVVSYAPLYIGSNDDADNRVATVGDVASAMSRSSSAARGAVARRGYKDNYNIEPTNLAWKIEVGGAPYFADLAVGAYTTVETNEETTVTNTVSDRIGSMTLNNQIIHHWSDLRAYIGSGFPLTEAADFAGNSATGVGSIQFAGSTNELAIIDGKLKYGGKSVSGIPNLEAGRNIELAVDTTNEVVTISTTDDVSFGDVQVRGNLTVYGQQNIQTIRRYYTNVYVGTQTNYVTTEMHTTNHQYQYLHVVTRTTNNVDEVINIGGDVDHSRAATVLSPSYSIDNHDTNAPALSATGFWDYTLASLALGTNAVSSFNGWTGAVGIQAGSNIVFGTDNATHTLTIHATVPEVDFSPYATAANLSGVAARVGAVETNIANHSGGMTNYVTGPELDAKLAEYAPASEINIIATNIEEIVSALSNPVIQTPDHKKWTMQGRYSGGKVTHVWVPYVGAYASPIRIAMPDGKIYEMAGRYMDGNTNLITHVWEEVTQ